MVFKTCNTKGTTRSKSEEKELKLHVRLFAQMYISTQIRGGDMNEFFSHETLKVLPSLSKNGEMRSGTKADLLKCFNLEPFNDFQTKKQKVDAACQEGSVLVNMTKPKKNQTFLSYCNDIFAEEIKKYANYYQCERTDLVFDTYKSVSLKAAARLKRGKGVRRKVETSSIAPTNWHAFLRINENKTELFRFISNKLLENTTLEKLVCDQQCFPGLLSINRHQLHIPL